MNNIIKFEFEGHSVTFDTDGWINATEIANKYGKRLDVWLKTKETKEYIACLTNSLTPTKRWKLIKTQQGRYGGTWLHPKLAVVFARWLSVDFAISCDLYIDAILSGQAESFMQYQNAKEKLLFARRQASKCGKGLAHFRWDKQSMLFAIETLQRQLPLPLIMDEAKRKNQ